MLLGEPIRPLHWCPRTIMKKECTYIDINPAYNASPCGDVMHHHHHHGPHTCTAYGVPTTLKGREVGTVSQSVSQSTPATDRVSLLDFVLHLAGTVQFKKSIFPSNAEFAFLKTDGNLVL